MNTLEYLMNKYPNKDWFTGDIGNNPNLTIDIVKKFKDKLFTGGCQNQLITRNTNITYQMIKNNPDIPWRTDSAGLIENRNFTIPELEEVIEKYGFFEKYKNDGFDGASIAVCMNRFEKACLNYIKSKFHIFIKLLITILTHE